MPNLLVQPSGKVVVLSCAQSLVVLECRIEDDS